MKSGYDIIKEYITDQLTRNEENLKYDAIQKKVESTRELMDKVGVDIFSQLLSTNNLRELSENDWKRMRKELEAHFNVKMKNAVILQGEMQQKRENNWWTSNPKLKEEGYYWNRCREYMKLNQTLSLDVIQTIDSDTDQIMNNLENPNIDNFNRYGMVVGHVQSGKTSNYSSLICKAADAGYKFIVVIAGGTNILRNQTQDRMHEYFIGYNDEQKFVGVGNLGGIDNEKIPVSITTSKMDFSKKDSYKNTKLDSYKGPVIVVIKKHANSLDNVIKWLVGEKKLINKIEKHAMLLIDDESDYASINTKEIEEASAINDKIRTLLETFDKSAYISYTATPYANIFIDHQASRDDIGKDLFPEDFICALEAPTNYLGARKIFIENREKYICEMDDYEEYIASKHKKDDVLIGLPESLYSAIRRFIINIAIRYLDNQENKHNSMLIHATRFTLMHKKIASYVSDYVKVLRKNIVSYGRLEDASIQSNAISILEKTFKECYVDIEFSWNEILDKLCSIIETVTVKEEYDGSKNRVEYLKNKPTNAIVIGGTSLSRGFTLEGLSISYFLRNTIFYDTLMQMGRWFGYRIGYEDLCKIYMTKEMADNFKFIIEATEELMRDFKDMEEAKKTPLEFGLAVRQNPDSALQVTARNKLKYTKDYSYEMRLDGCLKETSWLDKDEKAIEKNINVIRKIINSLERYSSEKIDKDYFWSGIDKKIVENFLEEFKVYRTRDDLGISTRMPIKFIKEYVKSIDTNWDISLYSGDGKTEVVTNNVQIKKEKRKIIDKENYYEINQRQVSSGTSESIGLKEREKLGSDRKKARANRKNPLLMLHIIEGKIEGENENIKIGAFGISFPGSIISSGETVSLKINSVYIEELLKEEEYDD